MVGRSGAVRWQANEWVSAALEPLGGKGGGKADTAQGQAKDVVSLEAAMEAARAFGKGALLVSN